MNCRGWVGGWTKGMAALAVGTVLLAPSLGAEDAAPAAAAQAARLSSVEGQVRIAQGGQVLADPALANTPLFEGTLLQTSEDGRAELQFDDGSVVRLSPNSSLKLMTLHGQGAPGDTEISLVSGLGYFELQGGSATDQIRVRFGDCAVTASGSAVFRIKLDNPPGEVAVFSGDAHVERGAALALNLHGGESVALSGNDPAKYSLADSIEPDSWDTWNSDRDQALTTEASARTDAVSDLPNNNNPAWNELDANGNWYDVPGQGYVWSPYEAADGGWDPYGSGYWMWTPSYSYIWVSGYPWGYMPYHCGTWNYFGGFGWGWAPGRCRLWWGGGGWISNIGYGPGGYRPPLRPHGPPSRGTGGPRRGGAANPLIAVNRTSPSGAAWLPARDSITVVTIGGHPVQPLRPVSPRPMYEGSTVGLANHSRPVYAGSKTPAVQRPAAGSRPASTPATKSSSVSQRSTPAPAPAPSHYSSGGGMPPSQFPSGGGGSGSGSPKSGGGRR